jgi:hypothetical protein
MESVLQSAICRLKIESHDNYAVILLEILNTITNSRVKLVYSRATAIGVLNFSVNNL